MSVGVAAYRDGVITSVDPAEASVVHAQVHTAPPAAHAEFAPLASWIHAGAPRPPVDFVPAETVELDAELIRLLGAQRRRANWLSATLICLTMGALLATSIASHLTAR